MEIPDAQPEYAAQLRRIAVLDERYVRALAERLDLNATSLNAMEWLMREGPLTPSDLAKRLDITAGAVTGVVNRLVATGHASRQAAESDGRSVRIAPASDSVDQATRLLMPLIIEMTTRASRYSEAELALVQRFLDDVARAYEHGLASLDEHE
jgi:DNA-binding MarR family transcriptional regulator